MNIHELKERYKGIWGDTADTFAAPTDRFDRRRQAKMDARMNALADSIILHVRRFNGGCGEDTARWGAAFKKLIYECGTEIVGLDDESMKLLLDGGFCEATSDFILKAREFDPYIKLDDIFQALRNVWIMNCIQKLTGKTIEITPAVLAYSLLYPYTDNFLDANEIPADRKKLLNQRFRRRLAGERVEPETPLEGKLYSLVGLIEEQYDREKSPLVFTSLLAIHDAQEKSLLLHGRSLTGNVADILDISFEKGGSSVLADAYLVNGTLTNEEVCFFFGFGILLQLLDDMQDAAADRGLKHTTVFSERARRGYFPESHTNRLINFINGIIDNDMCFMTNDAMTIKKIIKKSVMFLIFGAAACNSRMYGRAYIERLEEYSPLSFNFQKNLYKRIGREYGKLKLKLAVNPLEVQMARAFAAREV